MWKAIEVVLVVAAVLCLSGCTALLVRTASPEKLAQYGTATAVQQMKAAEAKVATVTAQYEKEIATIKAAKPTVTWPFYLVGALGMVGGLALGYFLKRIVLGVLLLIGGASLIGWIRFLEQFTWAFWIPFGLAVLAGLYFAWDWYQGIKAGKALDAIVPVIERIEPTSGKIKAAIAKSAGDTIGTVRKAVTAAKKRVGLES